MLAEIKQARTRIEVLRLALLSPAPDELGAALPGLEEAAQCLAAVESHMTRDTDQHTHAPYEVRRELRLLKNDLRIVTPLIEHGVAFCRGWAKMLGAEPGYTPAGVSEPLEELSHFGGTVSVRG
jgi:hypothetical protein